MLNLYSIKDIKADRFLGVVLFPNDEMAKRAFASVVNSNDSTSILHEYPEDAQIFRVGSFDDEKGSVSGDSAFLCNASDLCAKSEV